jgi:hypothetical protein
MVGLLYFAREERGPWKVYYIVLQRKWIHGRPILCYRGKGSMVALLYFVTEERDP